MFALKYCNGTWYFLYRHIKLGIHQHGSGRESTLLNGVTGGYDPSMQRFLSDGARNASEPAMNSCGNIGRKLTWILNLFSDYDH
jgi:hypothetical protein